MTCASRIAWEVLPDADAVSARAAALIGATLAENPRALLCLPTGETPTPTYARLARDAAPGLFAEARLLQLDEWGGLADDDPATCFRYLEAQVMRPLALRPEQLVRFVASARDPHAECARIQRFLDEEGPIDLCLLGLGANGHLGLIEPASALPPRAHVAKLSASTRQHSMLAGRDSRALYGLTLGPADLLQSRHIVLLVTGARKRAVLQKLKDATLTLRFPASLLHLHPRVTLLCDSLAYS